MNDFQLRRITIQQLSLEYFLNQSFPERLEGSSANDFYRENCDELQRTVRSNFNHNLPPFSDYQEYRRSVQDQITSSQKNRDQIRDNLSTNQNTLRLNDDEVNAIIQNEIDKTRVAPPQPKPPKSLIKQFIQRVREIHQWVCSDKYLKYVPLAIIALALVIVLSLGNKDEDRPRPTPSPVTSPTSLGSLGTITDGLEGMPIESTSLKNLVAKNNAIAQRHPAQSRTIVASVPITKGTSNATEILRGIALAQDEQNNQLNPKFYLFLKVADDGNEPDQAEKLATQFVEDREILGVIGHNSSDASQKAASKYKNNLVMISPTSTADSLTNDSRGYIYRVVQTDSELVSRLATYIKKPESNFEKVYICAAKDDKGKLASNAKSFATAFVKAMKDQATFDEECLLPISKDRSVNVDNQKELVKQKLTQDNYNSLLLAASTYTKFASWELAEIFRKPTFRKKGLFGNDALYTDIPLDKVTTYSSDGISDKLTLTAPWVWDKKSNPYIQNYVQKYKTQFPSENDGLNWRSAMSFDSTLALISAIDRVDSSISKSQDVKQKREAVAEALKNVTIPADQAATGEVRFTEEGDRDISVAPNLGGYIVQAHLVEADGVKKFIYKCIDGCDSSAAPKTDPQ